MITYILKRKSEQQILDRKFVIWLKHVVFSILQYKITLFHYLVANFMEFSFSLHYFMSISILRQLLANVIQFQNRGAWWGTVTNRIVFLILKGQYYLIKSGKIFIGQDIISY